MKENRYLALAEKVKAAGRRGLAKQTAMDDQPRKNSVAADGGRDEHFSNADSDPIKTS